MAEYGGSGIIDHAAPVDSKAGPFAEAQKVIRQQLEEQTEVQARIAAEALTVFFKNGMGIDHQKTALLRGIYAWKDRNKTQVWWTKTLEYREQALRGIQASYERKPEPPKNYHEEALARMVNQLRSGKS